MKKAALVFLLYALVGGFAGSVVAFFEPPLGSLTLAFVLGVPFGVAGGLHATRIYLKQKAARAYEQPSIDELLGRALLVRGRSVPKDIVDRAPGEVTEE